MPRKVTQQELESLVSVANQLRQLNQALEAAAGLLFERLEKGYEVEPGTHLAEIREERAPTKTLRELYINGQKVE